MAFIARLVSFPIHFVLAVLIGFPIHLVTAKLIGYPMLVIEVDHPINSAGLIVGSPMVSAEMGLKF